MKINRNANQNKKNSEPELLRGKRRMVELVGRTIFVFCDGHIHANQNITCSTRGRGGGGGVEFVVRFLG